MSKEKTCEKLERMLKKKNDQLQKNEKQHAALVAEKVKILEEMTAKNCQKSA